MCSTQSDGLCCKIVLSAIGSRCLWLGTPATFLESVAVFVHLALLVVVSMGFFSESRCGPGEREKTVDGNGYL